MIYALALSNLVLLVVCATMWMRQRGTYLKCLNSIQVVKDAADGLARVHENKVRRLTMNLVTAHDLVIELLQAQRLHTDMEESHALKALRVGIMQATTPEDRVRWLVSNVPKVIRAIANERLAMVDAQVP